jgi:hypothetical protein
MFRVVCYRFVTFVVSNEIAMHFTEDASIRKMSLIAGVAALLLGPILRAGPPDVGSAIVGDCRVSQVVDIRKGVHCMIPKSVFVKRPLGR